MNKQLPYFESLYLQDNYCIDFLPRTLLEAKSYMEDWNIVEICMAKELTVSDKRILLNYIMKLSNENNYIAREEIYDELQKTNDVKTFLQKVVEFDIIDYKLKGWRLFELCFGEI